MPSADFFSLFRLFTARNFFDATLCAAARSEMHSAARAPATVRKQAADYQIDTSVRSAKWVEVSAALLASTEERLLALKPQIEQHFNLSLRGFQPPQFLSYSPGDFYRPHRDRARELDAASTARERQISVIVFLNRESDEPGEDCYGGGSLTFYGLLENPGAANVGLPLTAEAGLLIAFRSEVIHEVRPVTHGERYTIATWFF